MTFVPQPWHQCFLNVFKTCFAYLCSILRTAPICIQSEVSVRGIEEAIILFTNNLYSHLDILVPKSYVKTLFIVFSSAFNTIQPHLLIPKLLLDIYVPKCTSLWILEFLTNRPQFVPVISSDHTIQSSTLIKHRSTTWYRSCADFIFYIYTHGCTST